MKWDSHAIVMSQRIFFSERKTLEIDFRLSALRSLQRALTEHEQELVQALYEDLGKPVTESYMTEIGMVKSEITYALSHLRRWSRKKRVPTPMTQFPARSYTVAEPYGVVLIISPWNYPLSLTLGPLVGAIAAGNCAVIKPSEFAPHVCAVLQEMLQCFPSGYITVVEGEKDETQALLQERFDYIFFTGSVSVGKYIMEQAAKHLTPVTLELGGKSPCIVERSADLSLSAKRIVFGKFLNAGQTCIAPDYVLVQEEVREEFLHWLKHWTEQMLTKDALSLPDYPKIVNQRHFDRLMGLLEGEEVYLGGRGNRETMQIAPTILTNVSPDAPVMQEEIFGPILPVLSFAAIEEAERFVKKREKPLALYLFTRSRKIQKRIERNVPFGGGCINDTIVHFATHYMPFGGVGQSGMGAYHGKASFDTFSHRKSILQKALWADLAVRYRPYTEKKEAMMRRIMK